MDTQPHTPPPVPAAVPVNAQTAVPGPATARKSSAGRTLLIILAVFVGGCGIAAATTAWWVKHNFYAEKLTPVSLSAAETQTLDAKLKVLDAGATPARQPEASPGEAERTLVITAKEINAYLASQNLGDSVQVDLGNDSLTATVLIPVPQDSGFPLISGTTLRLGCSVSAYMDAEKKVALSVQNVKVGGMPMPNAWLGGIKGLNLAGEDLEKDPAVQRFLAGIQNLKITPEGLRVVLAE